MENRELTDVDYQPHDRSNNKVKPFSEKMIPLIVLVSVIGLLSVPVIYFINIEQEKKQKKEQNNGYVQPRESNHKLLFDGDRLVTQELADTQYITAIQINNHEYIIYNNEHSMSSSIIHSASCKNH